jgi:ferredoxin
MSISSIDAERCVVCGMCVKICPADVIRLNKTAKIAEIRYPDDCQNCHLCRLFCPVGDDVISIEPGARQKMLGSWG